MSMRNPCLDAALRELAAAGIRDIEQVRGGKHWQLRWRVNGHGLRIYTLSSTLGDWRSAHNTRAEIRRILRADGVLAASNRAEPTSALASAPKFDRIAELERRMAAVEEFIRTIQPEGGRHD
jgi:sugar phosphate isomerase/epimerase